MKPWNRWALRPVIGLVIDQQRIALSVVATTPRGRREIAREIRACDDQSLEEVLGQMLAPWTPAPGTKRAGTRPRVYVGLPEARVFQATVPITATNRQNSPQHFFLEAVQATNLRAEDRIVDLIKLELNKQPLACLCACPRALVADLAGLLERLGARLAGIEPAPIGLVRAATARRRAPRGSRIVLRFFLGPQQAIGVLAVGAQPLFWHTFDLPPGEETMAILAAYSTLWMVGRHSRITLPIDTVIVHGRPEVALTQPPEAFRRRTGARLIRCAEPDYGPAAAALGTALADPLADEAGLDLARTAKPAPSVREIFPWGQLALHGALVGAVSLFLAGMATEAQDRLRAVDLERRAVPWLTDQDPARLDAEQRAIQDRLQAIQAFRAGRVAWSVPLRTVAAAAPEGTVITSLSGEAPVEAKSRSGPPSSKKQLIINFATPMPEDGSLPRELDGFLAALRGQPALQRSFPLITVSGLKANPARAGGRPFASYSLVCLPKMESAPKTETTKKAAAAR